MKMTENTQNFPEQTDTSNSKTNSFKVPTKCVKNMQDMSLWENSEAYQVNNHLKFSYQNYE